MNIKAFKEEYQGEIKAKSCMVGEPTRLFECEGGNALKTFKLMVELNKKCDAKILG